MMISTKGRYALRVMLDLAGHRESGYIPLAEIAARQKISEKYLESILSVLSKAGMLDALRGKGGGYRLAKDPADISVLQIISALDEDAKQSTRAKRTTRKNSAMVNGVKQTYRLIEESFDAYLDSLTVEALLDCTQDTDKGTVYLAERLEDESQRLASHAK